MSVVLERRYWLKLQKQLVIFVERYLGFYVVINPCQALHRKEAWM